MPWIAPRNLGLITGASLMGAVFSLASTESDIAAAHPDAVDAGMRDIVAVATILIVFALAIASRVRATATPLHSREVS